MIKMIKMKRMFKTIITSATIAVTICMPITTAAYNDYIDNSSDKAYVESSYDSETDDSFDSHICDYHCDCAEAKEKANTDEDNSIIDKQSSSSKVNYNVILIILIIGYLIILIICVLNSWFSLF